MHEHACYVCVLAPPAYLIALSCERAPLYNKTFVLWAMTRAPHHTAQQQHRLGTHTNTHLTHMFVCMHSNTTPLNHTKQAVNIQPSFLALQNRTMTCQPFVYMCQRHHPGHRLQPLTVNSLHTHSVMTLNEARTTTTEADSYVPFSRVCTCHQTQQSLLATYKTVCWGAAAAPEPCRKQTCWHAAQA